MRAVILGNKDLAVGCLDLLLSAGLEVRAVLNPDDDGVEEGRWYRSLRRASEERKVPWTQPPSINAPEGLAFLSEFEPDFLFSFSYSRIVREAALQCAQQLSTNMHFARLPHYRGCLPVVNAMANGDTEVGVTLHVMDLGIDSGDILAQTTCEVGLTDTAYSMYFKCVAAGIALFEHELPALIEGTHTRTSQRLESGSYFPQVYPNDRWLSPGLPADLVSSFVRALTFPGYPTARAMVGQHECQVVYSNGTFSLPELGTQYPDAESLVMGIKRKGWTIPS